MMRFGPTFIWTAVNLLILYFALRAILFKPVTRFMEKRAAAVRSAVEGAERDRREAMKLREEYEGLLHQAGNEAERLMDEARGRAEAKYRDIVDEARAEAQDILLRAREGIEQERRQMMRELKNQVVELVLLASSRVMEENMDSQANRVLVQRFIDEAGGE